MVPPRGQVNYSVHTKKTYVYWAKHFVLYRNERVPLEMRERDVKGFLTCLVVEKKLANFAGQTRNISIGADIKRDLIGQPTMERSWH